MKIYWDNLEKLKYNKKNGRWYSLIYFGISYLYRENCKVCKEPFLYKYKTMGKFCSIKCARQKKYNSMWKDGRSIDKNYLKKRNKKYYKKNKDKENLRNKKWRKQNKDKEAQRSAKRRALKLNQTPTNANKKIIEWYYLICKQMCDRIGISGFYQVDHIIPLSKKGLHHENNLQILTKKQNLTKKNKI